LNQVKVKKEIRGKILKNQEKDRSFLVFSERVDMEDT
jgi:hypothetical protein